MINADIFLKLNNNLNIYSDVKSILLKTSELANTPKISILIPTFNRVETLKQTLESCLTQVGFSDYNIIVCDNNPTRGDETEIFMSTITSPLVKYYKNEKNLGMVGNWNRLIQLSDGDYSVMIHDDDMLFPHFLISVYDCIRQYPQIDILYPTKKQWDQSAAPYPPKEILSTKVTMRKMQLVDFVVGNNYPPTGFLFKTKSMIDIGGYDYESYPSMDYYFNVRAVNKLNVFTISLPLYVYRWGINETLRKETQLNFMKVDVPLQKWICQNVPMFHLLKKIVYLNYSILRKKMLESTYGPQSISEAKGLIKTDISLWDKVVWKLFCKGLTFYNKLRISSSSFKIVIHQ